MLAILSKRFGGISCSKNYLFDNSIQELIHHLTDEQKDINFDYDSIVVNKSFADHFLCTEYKLQGYLDDMTDNPHSLNA